MAGVSELEGAVLNVIARSQPITAYAVRNKFQQSLTTSWSASAGSIYPLVRKLLRSHMISETKLNHDKRGTKMLKLTPSGQAALHYWLTTIDESVSSPVADPIRTRSYYLDSLSPLEQKQLVDEWQTVTKTVIIKAKESIKESQKICDPLEVRALRALELQMTARLRWLKELAVDI